MYDPAQLPRSMELRATACHNLRSLEQLPACLRAAAPANNEGGLPMSRALCTQVAVKVAEYDPAR